jgi:hypothetical protein
MRIHRTATVAAALVLATVAATPAIAAADDPGATGSTGTAEAIAAVEAVTPTPVVTLPAGPGETTEVGIDPDEAMTLATAAGTELSIGTPSSASEPGEKVGDSVVFPGVADDASIVTRRTRDAAQALIVVDGEDAPKAFRFPVAIDGGTATLRLRSDGGVDVYEPGAPDAMATVAPPWATDADGRPVPTRFEIQDGALTQIVDHRGAAYPVVADPKFTWGIFSGTLYFTRGETRRATHVSGLLSVVAGACAASAITGPFATALCGGIAGHAGVIAVFADYAYDRGNCLKIKLPLFIPGESKRGTRNCK